MSFKGVYQVSDARGKLRAGVTVGGKNIHLGVFKSELAAARVAREAREARDRGDWERFHKKLRII